MGVLRKRDMTVRRQIGDRLWLQWTQRLHAKGSFLMSRFMHQLRCFECIRNFDARLIIEFFFIFYINLHFFFLPFHPFATPFLLPLFFISFLLLLHQLLLIADDLLYSLDVNRRSMEYGAASRRVDLRLLRLFCLLPSKSEFVVFKYFNDIVLVLRLFVAIHAQPRALRKYSFSFVIPYSLPLSLLLHLLNCILTTIGRLTVFPILAASLLACLPMALLFLLVQISKDTAVLFNVLKYFRDIICGFTSR